MLKVATLFSGIGTPEQSLKHLQVEHETVFACEIDKYARTTYLANNEAPKTFYEDVYNIDGNKYKNQIDILIGGSPCQSFSIAGKRMGTSCPRGNLIYEYFRIVEESQPKVFIYENVKGFLSIDKGETFKNFVQSFKDLGYTTYHQILNTKDYLVPQNRERIYIVGFKDNVDFHFQEKQELKLRLKDMLEDEVDKKYLLNQTNINFMNTIWGKDTRWRKMKNPIDGCAGTICATHSKGLPRGVIINDKDIQEKIYKEGTIKLEQVATINIKGSETIKPSVAKNIQREMSDILKSQKDFYVCKADAGWQDNKIGLKTSPTIRANNSSIYGLDRANYIFRKLTPRECFRLQGFDDSFIFPPKMSDSQLYKQAGNGMSRNILDMIFTKIFTCYAKHIENIKE